MPVTFLIPGPLRPFSAGKGQIDIEQSPTNLADALEALWKRCPGIRDRVVTEQAQIREHINVFVGNEDVRYTGVFRRPYRTAQRSRSFRPSAADNERFHLE